jgi:hypothetical protein
MKISGFAASSNGSYQRFEETVFNTTYGMERVKEALVGIGWKHVCFARITDLSTSVPDPEKEPRIFVIAGE